jgi:hypothetical protein
MWELGKKKPIDDQVFTADGLSVESLSRYLISKTIYQMPDGPVEIMPFQRDLKRLIDEGRWRDLLSFETRGRLGEPIMGQNLLSLDGTIAANAYLNARKLIEGLVFQNNGIKGRDTPMVPPFWGMNLRREQPSIFITIDKDNISLDGVDECLVWRPWWLFGGPRRVMIGADIAVSGKTNKTVVLQGPTEGVMKHDFDHEFYWIIGKNKDPHYKIMIANEIRRRR